MRQLTSFLEGAGIREAFGEARYEASPVPYEILKAVEERQADLVVLSLRSTSFAKLVLGSVAEQVLRISPVDVLAVPPTRI